MKKIIRIPFTPHEYKGRLWYCNYRGNHDIIVNRIKELFPGHISYERYGDSFFIQFFSREDNDYFKFLTITGLEIEVEK